MKDLSSFFNSLAALLGAIGGLLAGITALWNAFKRNGKSKLPLSKCTPKVSLVRIPAFIIGISLVLLAGVCFVIALFLVKDKEPTAAPTITLSPPPTDMPIPPVPTSTSTPTVSPRPMDMQLPSPNVTPAHIGFEFKKPKSGESIPANSWIECEGSYSLPTGIDFTDLHIWIALKDDFGNYYLQSPPVELKPNGSWRAKNIRPGHGITQIVAVQVTQEGHKIFLGKVKTNELGAFLELPERSAMLAMVDIATR